MQNIDSLRAEIDQIHQDMVHLFQKRLALTEKIWEIKKSEQMPFFDGKREEQIIHRFDSRILDPMEKKAVQGFLASILLESRKYLETKIK
jgi:chorismate mutase